jgi:hypothetical protein
VADILRGFQQILVSLVEAMAETEQCQLSLLAIEERRAWPEGKWNNRAADVKRELSSFSRNYVQRSSFSRNCRSCRLENNPGTFLRG